MESIKKVSHSGDISYYNEYGYLHREDGPAVIWEDGFKSWWINGKKHREDGPAVIWEDGTFYFLNNKCYSYEEWLELIPNPIKYKWREYCEEKRQERNKRYLMIIYPIAIITVIATIISLII